MSYKVKTGKQSRDGQQDKVRTFEDLEVYKAAREFRKAIYAINRRLPDFEKFELASQIRRAAVSLTNNIAEGHGRYHFADDWQTPDIYVVHFDFGDKAISWDGQSCDPHGFEGEKIGVNFYGEKGTLCLAGNNYRILDLNDKVVREVKGKADDVLHFTNFHDAIRNGDRLKSGIEDGQKSTLLCHLGNIAWRSGHTVNFDPTKQKILEDRKAESYWSRQYRKGWEPKI